MLGLNRALLLCLWTLLSGANAIAFDAGPSSDSCDYYQTLENQFQCESKAPYLMAYAHHYCMKFKARKEHWSPRMQKWVENTTYCLQNELAKHAYEFRTCEQVREFGYASHLNCYISSGFCSLNVVQRLKIVATVSIPDLVRYSRKHMIDPFECSRKH